MRAQEAARLYNAGWAPQVWLTRGVEPAASLQEMHIAYIGEDFFNSRVLMHEGIPSNAILVLEPAINNTDEELRVITAELERSKAETVIIVTTKAHTRRVHTLWRALSTGRRVIVRAAPNDPFAPHHWWRTTRDALDVVRSFGAFERLGRFASTSLTMRRSSKEKKLLPARRDPFVGNIRYMRQIAPFESGQRVVDK